MNTQTKKLDMRIIKQKQKILTFTSVCVCTKHI